MARWLDVTARSELAVDIVCRALATAGPAAPPSAWTINDAALAAAQIENGGFALLVYNHGAPQLAKGRAAMRAIGAHLAVPLFDEALAICAAADAELARYRAGGYFGDHAPVAVALGALNDRYFALVPPARALADYVIARDEPWYDEAVRAYERAGGALDLSPATCLDEAISLGHLGLVQRAVRAAGGVAPGGALARALDAVLSNHDREPRSAIATWLLAMASVHEPDARGDPPLHIAAKLGAPWPDKLLALGASPHVRGWRDTTALHHVGDADTVTRLLAAGSDVHAGDRDGTPPILYATSLAVIERFIAAGVDPRVRTRSGVTLLHGVARRGEVAAIAALVARGLDVRATDLRGRTPLHDAQPAAIPVLVAAGAQLEARDARGRTPLHTVNHPDQVAALLAAGADVHAVDHEGRGVLHHDRHLGALGLLCAAGARLDLRDRHGRTPLAHARWALERQQQAEDPEERDRLADELGWFDVTWIRALASSR